MIGDLRILLSFVVLVHGAVISADVFRYYHKVKMHEGPKYPDFMCDCTPGSLRKKALRQGGPHCWLVGKAKPLCA